MDTLLQQNVQHVVAFFQSTPLDILFLVLLTALFLFAGMRIGKRFLVGFLLAWYPAVTLAYLFPWYRTTTPLNAIPHGALLWRGALFVLFLCICFFIVRRFVSIGFSERGTLRFVETLALSISIAGGTMEMLYQLIAGSGLYLFSPYVAFLFGAPYALFLWLCAPIIILLVFVSR